MPQLRIFTLGAPRLELDGKVVETDRRKATALLVYLAVTAQPHSREHLAALFWPESGQSQAFAYLRRALWEIKRSVGEHWLNAGRETVHLNHQDDLWLDVTAFRHARQGDPDELARAIDLYHGEFLSGFSLPDCPNFDQWVYFQAEDLRQEVAEAFHQLVDHHTSQEALELATDFARRWLTLDPLLESAHRKLMRLYSLSGQRNAAVRQYQSLADALDKELGVTPEQSTTALYEQILAGTITPQTPAERSGAPPEPYQPFAVPTQPTPFVGRHRELEEIRVLLEDPDCRLLALVGPGGAGKSRLAAQVSLEQRGAYQDGIFLVPLAPLKNPEFLTETIAAGLGFNLSAGEASPRQALLDFLYGKKLLMILDNFEHLLEGASLLVDILSAAPQVRMLVTSRERLNLQGEWTYPLLGLEVPPVANSTVPGERKAASSNGVENFSAAELFIQVAGRTRIGFTLTEADKPFVARICQMVEGMPLGIELAAAWTRSLTCAQIAREIERNMDFLESTSRDLPARHRSLKAVFEHSWDLLSAKERAIFQGLSVFRSPFSGEAAAFVTGASLQDLASLVDKSLLRPNAAGRYEVHELLRQYAEIKLEASPGPAAQLRAAHGRYYAKFLFERRDDLVGPRQVETLREINIEIEDIRSAWGWMVQNRDVPALLESLESLYQYYLDWSRPEGMQVFRETIAILSKPEPPGEHNPDLQKVYGLLLGLSSHLCLATNRIDEALVQLRESISILNNLDATRELARIRLLTISHYYEPDDRLAEVTYQSSLATFSEAGDLFWMALAHLIMSERKFWSGDLAEAWAYQQKSLPILKQLGNLLLTVEVFGLMGELAYRLKNLPEAKHLWQEGLETARAAGDPRFLFSYHEMLGIINRDLGEYEEALEHAHQKLSLARELYNRDAIASALDNLGHTHYLMGNYAEARENFQESLEIGQQTADRRGSAYSLQNLGDVARAEGENQQALRLYAESLANFEIDGDQFGMLIARKKSGHAACAMGDLSQAKMHYLAALELADRMAHFIELAEIFTGMAEMWRQTGKLNQAVELLAQAIHHPNTRLDVRAQAETLLGVLEGSLAPDTFHRSVERGKAADMIHTAKTILDSSWT